MEKFNILQIGDQFWRILDPLNDTFYLVEGETLAAVIDTGAAEGERITPMLRTLTDKPLILILTHAHDDHCHHMDEFDRIYMCHDELTMPKAFLDEMTQGMDLSRTIHIDTDSVIDLGGRCLEICKISGHTPGSVAIFDERDQIILTGDSIGSGCGVWMQLPGSTSLAEYEQSLLHFQKWLMVRSTYPTFWGGHCLQRNASAKVPGDNPVTFGLLADLIDLVHGLIHGTIFGRHIEMSELYRAGKEARNAAFGSAEITYNPDNLR
jgi:glyoxylase-like metal-dependent hydrolase (beta-lactamase superfamily II)